MKGQKRRAGSSPATGTNLINVNRINCFVKQGRGKDGKA